MMETTEVKKRGRGRPRKRKLEDDENEKKKTFAVKKQALDSRWRPLVGRYVLKEFLDNGVFLGKIVYYDSGLYRVDYEDGDCEDLESNELRNLVLGDEYFDDDLTKRKLQLDEMIAQKNANKKKHVEEVAADFGNEVGRVESSAVTELSGRLIAGNNVTEEETGVDSSSDSCEYTQERDLETEAEVPLIPPPHLPPSSGNIGVLEEYVGHLLSVYTFLRSFNIRLFLSPFSLDDLVGALKCQSQNTLLDAIHVALLRALKQHIETLSSEGSELATKCLRSIEWSLLDALTWPVYVVNYFAIMGYTKGLEWEEFYNDLLTKEYYVLTPGRKLMILQILCDDVLDCVGLRAEIDLREESEFGIDPEAITTDLIDNGPRRVHPRYSKTSACKNMEIAGSNSAKSYSNSHCLVGSKGIEGNGDAPSADADRNSDECLLCGMDGFLLCCDGCPASYHSRCIGVIKMYIPDGPWYCPECTINKSGPTITTGTLLRGAEIFGTDLYGQVFLGTCNHLLVIKTSVTEESYLRYYTLDDIPKVLQALSAFMQHRRLYFEISKAILQHWRIPESVFSPLEMTEKDLNVVSGQGDLKLPTSTSSFVGEESHKVTNSAQAERSGCNNADIVSLSSVNVSMGVAVQAEVNTNAGNSYATGKQSCVVNPRSFENIRIESFASVNQQTSPSDVTHQGLADKSSVIELNVCTSATSDSSHIGHANSATLPAIATYQREHNQFSIGTTVRSSAENSLYLGDRFKPNAYINHYVHGHFAARAASNFVAFSSEETRGSEAHKLGNSKKHVSDIILQTKAFSAAASRFFWPSSEKKLMEVPRERCGWCHSCKLSSSNTKRGCMLNAAVLAATKGTIKILTVLRPVIGEGSIASISTYILYMGEMLCGLTVGPFLNASYRNQWRQKVEDADNCCVIRGLLLELEQSIRAIALSGDWVKPADDWLLGSPTIQISAGTAGTTQRCGPIANRGRRKSVVSDTIDRRVEKTFVWWRGGKLYKHVFHKAILPPSVVRRVARQGCSRKFYGIYYADDSEIPKRSKQLSWRAAVERSRNASQLAIQVRYLDFHVRWSDLIRVDQNIQDGKGSETEASVFRNAKICDKKIVEDKVRYAVAFGSQKHLSSRVMKNIIETDAGEEGKEQYWFLETNVPLYLIKEYEESLEKQTKEVVQPPIRKSLNELSDRQKGQLKASRKDIFLYLTNKRDKTENCLCASCQLNVLLRDAIKCIVCQGYCHKDCTNSSRIWANQKIELLITCKTCGETKSARIDKYNEPLQIPSVKVPECNQRVSVPNGTKKKTYNNPLVSVRSSAVRPEKKQATSSSNSTKTRNKVCNWGLIWKKKNAEDTGSDFRQRNIISRGSPNGEKFNPICILCNNPYNCDLLYIHCEFCNHWYHADAVDLEESRLCDLVGFKCCRCRRIKPPGCPYKREVECQKTVSRKLAHMLPKQHVAGEDSDSGTISDWKVSEPSTPMFPMEEVLIPDDDPLLFSLSKVEQITDCNSGLESEWNMARQGTQKLPVKLEQMTDYNTGSVAESNIAGQGEQKVPVKVPQITDYDSGLESEWNMGGQGAQKLPARRQITDYNSGLESEWNIAGQGAQKKLPVKVEQITDYNSGLESDLNMAGQGAQKLPVRRQMKHEENNEGYIYNAASVPLETSVGMNPKGELCTLAEWNSSSNGIINVSDYGFNYEDMEFEPQTYFSFNELLESDDSALLDGIDTSKNSSAVGSSGDKLEETIPPTSTGNEITCKMCLHIEPAPDLFCEICGLVLHRHCSPWVEYSTTDGNWRCGNCREWRVLPLAI